MKSFQEVRLEQKQQLAVTQKMVQHLNILKMSVLELNQHIQDEMLENPVIDVDEQKDRLDTLVEYIKNDVRHPEETSVYDDTGESDFEAFTSVTDSLKGHLLTQLGELHLKTELKKVVRYMIENINADGYYRENLRFTAAILNVSYPLVKTSLRVVQGMSPSGVGARSLKECLAIQLNQAGLLDDVMKDILLYHLDLLAKRSYSEIAKKTGQSREYIIKMHDMIKQLNPRPGQSFCSEPSNPYVFPELMLKKTGDSWEVAFNEETLPVLRVHDYYRNILKDRQSPQGLKEYIQAKLQRAVELIDAIEQRKRTILNIAGRIIEYQKNFIEDCSGLLKPLTMKMLADSLGIHESTVSRTVNNKFIATPKGTFELKFFFTSSVQADNGSKVSSALVKDLIYEIVMDEDKRKPLSDEQIRTVLEERGIKIARRTVAKYREELSIFPAAVRKSYS